MKKILLLSLIASMFMFGCGPDDGPEPGDGGTKAPTTYTQKSILEYFSGAWCGYCPDGKTYSQNLATKYGDDFISVVYHRGDNMDIPGDNIIDETFNEAGYPTGMINRVGATTETRTGWDKKVNLVLNETAKCGLAVDASSVNGNELNLKVKLGIGAESLPEGNYFLTVLLVEKEITGEGTGYDQTNYYDETAGSVWQGKGNPIVGYKHDNVVQAVLTDAMGDKLSAEQTAAGALSEFDFSINTGIFGDDVKIVAFISEFSQSLTGGTSSLVYNANEADKGQNSPFN